MSWKLAGVLALALVLGTALARLTQDPDTGTLSWDAARASGFAGYLLLWGSVMAGLLIHLRVRPFGYQMTYLIEGHRMLSALSLSFVAAHVFAMLVDPTIRFSVLDVVVPFYSSYRPFQVGVGGVALWLLVLVLASTALSASMPYRLWRRLHYLAFPCWALALLHGLINGTDTSATLAIWLYVLTAMSVVFVGVYRIFGRDWVQMGDAPIRPVRR